MRRLVSSGRPRGEIVGQATVRKRCARGGAARACV